MSPMPGTPEDLHPALVAAYNAGDVDAVLDLYDPQAVFVVKPGRVTDGPAELRAAIERIIGRGARLAITPRTFVRSHDVALVLGSYELAASRRDGTPVQLAGRFADVLRRHPDGRWLIAVDDGFADD
jgi:uncharacterized protein (TIGR02246 family)